MSPCKDNLSYRIFMHKVNIWANFFETISIMHLYFCFIWYYFFKYVQYASFLGKLNMQNYFFTIFFHKT